MNRHLVSFKLSYQDVVKRLRVCPSDTSRAFGSNIASLHRLLAVIDYRLFHEWHHCIKSKSNQVKKSIHCYFFQWSSIQFHKKLYSSFSARFNMIVVNYKSEYGVCDVISGWLPVWNWLLLISRWHNLHTSHYLNSDSHGIILLQQFYQYSTW